jgi:hypothetical protein
MSKRRSSAPSLVYAKIAGVLDDGFRGTYGQLARAVGSHPRAVGSVVRRYSELNPAWDHMKVFSARTGRPALLRPSPSGESPRRFPPRLLVAVLGAVTAALGVVRSLIALFNRRC